MNSLTIKGDGSYAHTTIEKDGEVLSYVKCIIVFSPSRSMAIVDNIKYDIDLIVLNGYNKLIGGGKYNNTKMFSSDEMLRGIQRLVFKIEKNNPTIYGLKGVFLPNIVEVNDE